MNLERYGLTQAPFGGRGQGSFAPVPSRMQPIEALQQALVDGQGIVLLTAGAGLGKTAICRELEHRLQGDWLVVLLRDAGYTSRRSLLQAMLYELGLPYTGLTEQEARLRLLESIRDRQPQQSGLILLADEAQRLSDRLLEELRSLLNHEHDGQRLVRLLLCGDLVLEERLISPGLDSINQRVICHETLVPLSHEESAQLVDYRIVQAGGDGWEHVFTRAAMELLCLVCDGSPRNLEQLAKRSLQFASDRREPRVSVDAVRSALEELKELPLQWNEPSNLDAYSEQEVESAEGEEQFIGVEAFADMLDDPSIDPADDAVSVVVGDELPTTGWESPAGAFAIEVGGDWSPAPVAHEEPIYEPAAMETGETGHVLLDDHAIGLADTAVLHRGTPAPTLAEWSARVAREVSGGRIYGAGEPAEPVHAASEWTELEVADPYAALDAAESVIVTAKPRTLAIAAEPTPVTAAPEVVSDDLAQDDASSSVFDFEEELLEEVHEIAQEVTAVLEARPAAERSAARDRPSTLESSPWCSGFSAMPEWDVVQPEWLNESPFTPIEIDRSHELDLQPLPEPTFAESVAEAPAEPVIYEPAAAVVFAPIAEDDRPAAFVINTERSAETTAATQQLRVDEPGQRPYSQLFSRLRRLRSSFRKRLQSAE
jgi:type II secretory pathway predicted ATPase ExeA